jgi:hypothetical protein
MQIRLIILLFSILFIPSLLLAEAIPKYKRSYFGNWQDFDGDCQNTRHELLQKLSTSTYTLTENTCRVLTGRWLDPYTNKVFTMSKDVDIDHLVPLSYAWKHGAFSWSKDKRMKFANDERNLFAVQSSVNREKSDSGPLKWLPPNINFRCEYILRFKRIMTIYNLKMTAAEADGAEELQRQYCGRSN